jgi:hypothetical protein
VARESPHFDWEETSAESLDEALTRVRSQSACRMEWVSIFGQVFPIASDPPHPEPPLLKSAKAAVGGAGGS